MTIIRGTTPASLRRSFRRIQRIDTALHQFIDALYKRTDAALSQAIADRQATIRMMNEELHELYSLSDQGV